MNAPISTSQPPAAASRRRRRAAPALLGAGILAVLAVGLVPPAAGQQDRGATAERENRRCLNCHGQASIASLSPEDRLRQVATPAGAPPSLALEPAVRPGLYLDPADLARETVHAGVRCVDCHRDAAGPLPHTMHLDPATCTATCHASASAAFMPSVHGTALARHDPDAPRCSTCHGSHDIRPADDRDSPTYPLNVINVCGDCHEKHATPSAKGRNPTTYIQAYLDSVHGRAVREAGLVVAATCADCHGAHDVLPPTNPASRTNRLRIPTTCGHCHEGVLETYSKSIHGKKFAEGDERAPVCTDCHTAHAITRAGTPAFLRDIVNECGECHDRPDMSQGRRETFYQTYRASYHGQVNELGSTRAARCSSCHGAHDILPLANPASRLHGANRIVTCRKCHEGAPASLAEYDPHADFRDGKRYPLLNVIWWYFIIVISSALGFFGIHSILWFVRSLVERLRHGRPPRHVANPHAIRRFTVLNRVNHAFLIVSFFGLTVTGLPLFFSDREWAQAVSGFLGGGHVLGVLHRSFAVLLVANFLVHVVGLARKLRASGSWRNWLTGPTTMLPRFKDVRDCLGMFRWFFRGGRPPAFDRWTYWEKFDYLAEIFGTLVIGGSGLLLWFPDFFAALLPGSIFNVALIIHGYEALLAVSFIFTIHFFNAHLRVEKFPVDDVIFTGRLPEEELRHERPAEFERLVASGQLDALKVPPAPPWQRRVAIAVGVVAMAIGFTIVVLIILAGLEAL